VTWFTVVWAIRGVATGSILKTAKAEIRSTDFLKLVRILDLILNV